MVGLCDGPRAAGGKNHARRGEGSGVPAVQRVRAEDVGAGGDRVQRAGDGVAGLTRMAAGEGGAESAKGQGELFE